MKPELRKIIEIRALEYGIDPDLVEALCFVESSFNPKATRYEPAFFKTYILPMLQRNEISPVEATGRATSWGLMQLMGQVAREKGFKGQFEELFEPAAGLHWALKHLRHFLDRYPNDIDQPYLAIAAYNAGSPRYKDGKFVNQQYVDKVNKYLNQLKEG